MHKLTINRDKLRDNYTSYGITEMWYQGVYGKLPGRQVLDLIGQVYHDMLAHNDVRKLTYGKLRFIRMVLNFPTVWKSEILVNDRWEELTALLAENNITPTDPADVKATWPRGQRKERIKLKPCSDCGKFTQIGCAVDDSGIRLCKNCCNRHSLDTTKTRLSEKSKTLFWNDVRSKVSGHTLGTHQPKTIRVEFAPKLPFRAPFTREVEENGIKTTQIKLFAAQKWAKAITIELNSVNFFHSFPKSGQKQCLASETEGNKGQTNKENEGYKGGNGKSLKGQNEGQKKGRNKGSDTSSNGNNGMFSKTKGKRSRFKLLKKGKRQLGSFSEPLKKGRKRVKVAV